MNLNYLRYGFVAFSFFLALNAAEAMYLGNDQSPALPLAMRCSSMPMEANYTDVQPTADATRFCIGGAPSDITKAELQKTLEHFLGEKVPVIRTATGFEALITGQQADRVRVNPYTALFDNSVFWLVNREEQSDILTEYRDAVLTLFPAV